MLQHPALFQDTFIRNTQEYSRSNKHKYKDHDQLRYPLQAVLLSRGCSTVLGSGVDSCISCESSPGRALKCAKSRAFKCEYITRKIAPAHHATTESTQEGHKGVSIAKGSRVSIFLVFQGRGAAAGGGLSVSPVAQSTADYFPVLLEL